MVRTRTWVVATALGLALGLSLLGCASSSLEPWEGQLSAVEYEDVLPTRLQDWAAARRGDYESGYESVSDAEATWIGVAGGGRRSTGFELVPQDWVIVEFDTLDPADDLLVLTVQVLEPTSGAVDVFDNPLDFYRLTPPFPGRVEVELVEPDGAR